MEKEITVISAQGEIKDRLVRLSPKSKLFDETLLQNILFKEPRLLPTEEINPDYSRLITVGKEVSVRSGSIDLLYVTPMGLICLVETKLWRNPEQHRTVIAQIIDYAKDLSRMGFDEFTEAVTRKRGDEARAQFFRLVKPALGELDDVGFQSNVQDSLSHGRFLMLIVGDRIYPEVALLAESVGSAPHLEFSISLVELSLYHFDKSEEQLILVSPSVVGRTVEATRAVVKIIYEEKAPEVEVTSTEAGDEGGRGQADLEGFLKALPEGFDEPFKDFYDHWVERGYIIAWRTVGFTIRKEREGRMVTLLQVFPNTISLFTDKHAESNRLPLEPCRRFQERVRGIKAANKIISEKKVYLYYHDINVDEFSTILSELDKTLMELFNDNSV